VALAGSARVAGDGCKSEFLFPADIKCSREKLRIRRQVCAENILVAIKRAAVKL
jgi:hypothetical protein